MVVFFLQRKKTLQKEYEQSTKSSVFVDKRIGEKDDTLQEFDKAVLRLQRERQVMYFLFIIFQFLFPNYCPILFNLGQDNS